MVEYQFWILFTVLAAGFGWIIHTLTHIDKRLTDVEKILSITVATMSIPRKKEEEK